MQLLTQSSEFDNCHRMKLNSNETMQIPSKIRPAFVLGFLPPRVSIFPWDKIQIILSDIIGPAQRTVPRFPSASKKSEVGSDGTQQQAVPLQLIYETLGIYCLEQQTAHVQIVLIVRLAKTRGSRLLHPSRTQWYIFQTDFYIFFMSGDEENVGGQSTYCSKGANFRDVEGELFPNHAQRIKKTNCILGNLSQAVYSSLLRVRGEQLLPVSRTNASDSPFTYSVQFWNQGCKFDGLSSFRSLWCSEEQELEVILVLVCNGALS